MAVFIPAIWNGDPNGIGLFALLSAPQCPRSAMPHRHTFVCRSSLSNPFLWVWIKLKFPISNNALQNGGHYCLLVRLTSQFTNWFYLKLMRYFNLIVPIRIRLIKLHPKTKSAQFYKAKLIKFRNPKRIITSLKTHFNLFFCIFFFCEFRQFFKWKKIAFYGFQIFLETAADNLT